MDESELGNDVQKINELTVIASESYDSFAKALQSELAENVTDRPIKVTPELFKILPFIASLILLIFTSKKSRAPKAEGVPFDVSKR